VLEGEIFSFKNRNQKLDFSMTRPSCADLFSVQVCTTLRQIFVCLLLPLRWKRAAFFIDMVEIAQIQLKDLLVPSYKPATKKGQAGGTLPPIRRPTELAILQLDQLGTYDDPLPLILFPSCKVYLLSNEKYQSGDENRTLSEAIPRQQIKQYMQERHKWDKETFDNVNLDAYTGSRLQRAEAPNYDGLDAIEAPHDELDIIGAKAPFEPPLDEAEAPVPEAAQYELGEAEQRELDAAMDAEYNVRTREGMRPRRRPNYGQLNATKGTTPEGQAEGDMVGNWVSTGNRGTINVETVVEDSTVSGEHGNAKTNHAKTPQNNDDVYHPGKTDEAADAAEAAVLGFIFMQVLMEKGLKRYGDKGEAAVEEELQQLHS
jgi:hypothetical protein